MLFYAENDFNEPFLLFFQFLLYFILFLTFILFIILFGPNKHFYLRQVLLQLRAT